MQSYRDVISRSWLNSAKLARKAQYWQSAYSATLQAQQRGHPFAYIESSKLAKAVGEPLRALQELEASMQLSQNVTDLTENEEELTKMKAKVVFHLLRYCHR